MKKLIACVLLASLSFGAVAQTHHKRHQVRRHHRVVVARPSVYVCNSSSAYAYHSSQGCRGIQRCTHGISRTTVSQAHRTGYKPCKICY